MIDRVPYNLEIVARTSTIKETIAILKIKEFDLIFLDINLSDGFSFEIFEPIGFDTPPIIFYRLLSEFAIKAFELNSISYLLKPVTSENLSLALKKFRLHNQGESNKEEINTKYRKLVNDLRNPYKQRF